MRRCIVLALAAVMLFSLAACGVKKAEPETVGGWALTQDAKLTDQAQKAFDKAMEGLVGVRYTPVGLLGTQIVSGTNYCFLCEAAVVYPNAQPYYALVYVYETLRGEAKIAGIVTLNLGEIAESGEVKSAQAPEGGLMGGWTVDRESRAEAEGAVMHLASQVVAGTMHCVLCRGWNLCFVYENLEGKTELKATVPLDIAALSQSAGA